MNWELYFEIGQYAVWRRKTHPLSSDGYLYRIDNAFDGKPSENCGGWHRLSEILKRKGL